MSAADLVHRVVAVGWVDPAVAAEYVAFDAGDRDLVLTRLAELDRGDLAARLHDFHERYVRAEHEAAAAKANADQDPETTALLDQVDAEMGNGRPRRVGERYELDERDERRSAAGGDNSSNSSNSCLALAQPALHGLAGDWVELTSPHTESDPAARLVQFLAAFGIAVTAGPHTIADGAVHRARLYALVVGASAKARKGTAMGHVRNVFRVAAPQWLADGVKSGLSSGEGLIEAVADPTLDKDGNDVGGVTDKRLLLVESEFGRVLTAGGRDGSTLSAVVRQAWDEDRLSVLTRKPLTATGAHVGIVGHIVVEELRAKLTETDRANGFANRFLFVHAHRWQRLPNPPPVPERELDELGRRLGRVLEAGRKRGRMHRTPAAEELWATIYDKLGDDDPGGMLGAVTARAEAQVLRLSLVYALLDGAPAIDVEHLDAAAAVWWYCRATAQMVFGDRIGDAIADKLLAGIRADPAGLTTTQQSALFGRNVTAARLQAARDQLVEKGFIELLEIETDGRPATVARAVRRQPSR